MIRIRPYRREDYDVVRRWIDDREAGGPFTLQVPKRTDDEIRRFVSGEGDGVNVRFAVEAGGAVIGEVQYRRAGQMPGVYELGIGIWDPAQRGKGYGREAQRQLIELIFGDLGGHRVQAGTEPANVAERRVLESLGFTEEGILRGYLRRPGSAGDIVMYSVLKEEWPPASPGQSPNAGVRDEGSEPNPWTSTS